MSTIILPRRLVNRADFPKHGWERRGKRIDAFADDGLLARYGVYEHCDCCGCRTRYFYALVYPGRSGLLFVGEECLRRLTLSFWQKQNGNWCARICNGPRGIVTVFRADHGLWWRVVYRNRYSRDFSTAEEAMDSAWDFATEVRHA